MWVCTHPVCYLRGPGKCLWVVPIAVYFGDIQPPKLTYGDLSPLGPQHCGVSRSVSHGPALKQSTFYLRRNICVQEVVNNIKQCIFGD